MAKATENELSITLKGKEIPIQRKRIRLTDLSYYPENPRVYSIVRSEDGDPDQREIERALLSKEHVKQLIQAIQANDGLTDPLLVRAGDNVVLEGNSRLAAYRALAKKDAVRWGEVKCDVVPEDITAEDVFTLLVQYHIIGRKDWDPFEQAGLLWRRANEENVDALIIAEEMGRMGVSTTRANQMIQVYQFMVDHEDTDPNRWSYYDEMHRSRPIQRAREEHPEFDSVIVDKIRRGEIGRAIDVREKVAKIAQVGGKTLTAFIQKPGTLEKCHDRAIARGANNVVLKRLSKFRAQVVDPDLRSEMLGMSETQQKKCRYELEKIQKAVTRLLGKIAT